MPLLFCSKINDLRNNYEIISKNRVSLLKRETTCARFVASMKQNAFDGRYLTNKK